MVDSRCSFHTTPHKEWFSTYEEYDGSNIYISDNSSYPIVKKEKVLLRFSDGRIKTLPGVLHVLRLARNLILDSNLKDLVMHVTFDKHGYRLVRGKLVVAKGKRFVNLFKLEATTVCNASYVSKATTENTCMLWHHRLGHTSNNVLKTIKNK